MMILLNDVFDSISGEGGGFPQGTWCRFIRLQGCNLSCRWCDTKQSNDFSAGGRFSVKELIEVCEGYDNIFITGGEPLMQENALLLLIEGLLKGGKKIQIETNGSLPFPPRKFIGIIENKPVNWVVDYKCPSSGMHPLMLGVRELARHLETTKAIGNKAFMKFVVEDDIDLRMALNVIRQLIDKFQLHDIPYLISPINGEGNMLKGLIKKITEKDKGLLNHIVFSVQIHKLFDLM